MADDYDPAENSRKSYDVAIDAMRDKLASFRCERIHDATLYLGDCREILPLLPRVDAVVTDPPYGIGMDGGRIGKANYEQLSNWDSVAADVSGIVALGVPTIIWGGNYFDLPPSASWLVWDKETAGITTFADAELAWTNLPGSLRLKRHLWSGPYQKVKETRFHPTQKPTDVIIWCLERINGARTILDPFMGSGTTGVACAKLGRRFIGIELEPRYFEIACKRIDDAYRQPRLFKDEPPKPKQEALL
jgi:DNA modification methylase